MYNNIVIAYDDSEFSKAALLESSRWIKRHGGNAVLVHSVFFDEEEFVIDPAQREKRLALGKKACYRMRDTISADFGFNGNFEALICEGEPHEVLVEVAKARHSDLIAMGTHGRKGLKKLFLGSVTSRVIASSPCDVLVMKKLCERCNGSYESILLSFDGSEFSEKALLKACVLSQTDGSKITAVNVIPRYEDMIGFFSTSIIKENLQHDAEKIIEKARDIAEHHGIKIQTEVTKGDEAEKIAETATRLKSDLIIRGTHGWTGINRTIMGGVSERVVIDAPCPVLIVK